MANTFDHIGTYTCVCGKVFNKSQSFNAHKSHCKAHLGETRYNMRLKQQCSTLTKANEILKNETQLSKLRNDAIWNSQKHYCERCGKQFFKKIGQGRFCSKSCSNARSHSIETKLKIAESVSNCNSRQSCHGYYKGFIFQSSYELIFLAYCLDNGIKIERCPFTFIYTFKEKNHVYIPDFYLPESNTIVELKSEYADTTLVQLKAASVDTKFSYKLYYGKDLAEMWKWCKVKYNVKSYKELCEKLSVSAEDYKKLYSEEHKISWNKGKSNPAYGKHWYTNGCLNVLSDVCPTGYHAGRV